VTGYSRVPAPPARMMPFLKKLGTISGNLSSTAAKTSLRVQTQPLAPVNARGRALDPARIVQIPLDRGPQPASQVPLGPPVELAPRLGRVDRIAAVVPWPVLDEGHQRRARPAGRVAAQLVDDRAQRADHLQVGALAVAADIVGLARPPALKR